MSTSTSHAPIERCLTARMIVIRAVPVTVAVAGTWFATRATFIPAYDVLVAVLSAILIVVWVGGTWQVAWRATITESEVRVWPVWRGQRSLPHSAIRCARPTSTALMLEREHRFRGRIQLPSAHIVGLDNELREIARLWPAPGAPAGHGPRARHRGTGANSR